MQGKLQVLKFLVCTEECINEYAKKEEKKDKEKEEK